MFHQGACQLGSLPDVNLIGGLKSVYPPFPCQRWKRYLHLKTIGLETGNVPAYGKNWGQLGLWVEIWSRIAHTIRSIILFCSCRTMQKPIPSFFPAMTSQTGSNVLASRLALKPSPMQEAEVLRTGSFASKPKPSDVSSEILVHFQSCPRWPVGVATECPRLQRPARIQERRWHRNVLGTVHISQNGENLLLRFLVCLRLDSIALVLDYRHKQNSGAFKEAWAI